ncbi:hypothetical protein J8J14_20910 [Roseomonas sp. SSH11]|uniref:Polysaccharide chain length determinant N-terminal domain-containing protein n=1 Tax=Pararoseomonas baculiformis TaxID=2820812 RepID=A0ABS4AJP1_9PROT|nr:hypothetical protein [Pararoseomonas baculiformis]MBP0447237.1 hypothetical protein [Pararoseomonas baculiformis]
MSDSGAILAPRDMAVARYADRRADDHGALSREVVQDAPAYGAPAPGFRLKDLVTTFFLRWRLLLVALLIPALLGFAVGPLLQTRYTAYGSIVVLTSRDWAGAADISGFGPTVISVEMLKVVRSEVEIMQSQEVARRVLLRLGVSRVFPGMREAGSEAGAAEDQLALAVEQFQRSLRVETDTNSNIIRARFTHTDRQTAIAALSALLDSYYERRAEVFSDENARILVSELNRYTQRLRSIEAAIQAVKEKFNVLDITQEVNLTTQRVDSLIQREERVQEQRATAEAQLRAAQAQLAAQPVRVFASQEATNLAPNDETRNVLSRLMLERRHMAAQYRSDYPGLRELDERIAAARNAARDAQRSTFSTTREVRNPAVELLNGRVVTLQVETAALQRQIEELERQRTQAEIRAADLRDAESQLRDLNRQREATEAILRQFSTREAGARAEEEARRDRAPNVQTLEAPSAPVNGRSARLLAAAGGIAGGGALMCGLALLLTLTRRSFATQEEAARGLSLSPLAGFGDLHKAANDLKEMPAVADLAALLLDTRRDGRRPCVIQFISGGKDDRRGELVRSLAVELARRRSADTLIIDLQTDGRGHLAALGSRPLDVERIPGHVLTFSTVVPNLWVSFEAQDSHLTDPHVGRAETAGLIRQLRSAFDVVLVIGPDEDESYPMRRLTGLVDLNLLVVRAEETRGDRARRMRDWVLGSGGALLGFVLTGERRVMPRRIAEMI